jgi:AcrR family transcriptional regulator
VADANITKHALASSLKNLMREKSFDKISVSDICDGCGMNRKSFYYHFKDKYDLATWMLFRDWDTALEQFGGNYSREQLTAYLETIRGHQLFYRRLYNDEMNALLPKFIFQQEAERIRRQKRRRSRRAKAKMLADKHAQSEKKALRRRPSADE